MNGTLVCARRTRAAAVALMAAACAAPPPKPAAPAVPPPLDASYDWHAILIAPFGSALKDFPLAVHEVLLFRDAAPGAPAHDDPECYAVEGKAPRFMARSPSEYLVCFTHDRLSRVEASVRLARAESAQIFADACGLWTKNTPAGGRTCEGADGTITFAAHLESDADAADAQLVVELDSSEPFDR
ncbi:MAG: hypothetical protein M3O26_07485 [Pseudomonadota bacterium]|nr:hypothetical protein [Pseudomonadota bacterium]